MTTKAVVYQVVGVVVGQLTENVLSLASHVG
jgi:hypothetical protein